MYKMGVERIKLSLMRKAKALSEQHEQAQIVSSRWLGAALQAHGTRQLPWLCGDPRCPVRREVCPVRFAGTWRISFRQIRRPDSHDLFRVCDAHVLLDSDSLDGK